MSPSMGWPFRASTEDRFSRQELQTVKVKSILKSEPNPYKPESTVIPDVTSFFLDKDEGTLV